VWKSPHVETVKLQRQPLQPLTAYMSPHPSTFAGLEKLALPENYRSHNAELYCICSTPRITTAARVPCLGFWGPPMSNKCDVAAFGWCWLAAHRRPARTASPGPNFALRSRARGQMTSGLLYRSVGSNASTSEDADSETLLSPAKLSW
jgi:hypothetical protein